MCVHKLNEITDMNSVEPVNAPSISCLNREASDIADHAYNLLTTLRNLRRTVDGTPPAVEPEAKLEELVGIIPNMERSHNQIISYLSDIERELSLLGSLL